MAKETVLKNKPNKKGLDIKALAERTREYTLLDGRVINVYAITYGLYKELLTAIHQTDDTVIENNERVMKIVKTYLDNNKEGEEVTYDQLKEYPNAAIVALYNEMSLDAADIETDPF